MVGGGRVSFCRFALIFFCSIARNGTLRPLSLLQTVGKMGKVEVMILVPVKTERVEAYIFTYPVLGTSVPVAVNEAHFAVSRVLFPETCLPRRGVTFSLTT